MMDEMPKDRHSGRQQKKKESSTRRGAQAATSHSVGGDVHTLCYCPITLFAATSDATIESCNSCCRKETNIQENVSEHPKCLFKRLRKLCWTILISIFASVVAGVFCSVLLPPDDPTLPPTLAPTREPTHSPTRPPSIAPVTLPSVPVNDKCENAIPLEFGSSTKVVISGDTRGAKSRVRISSCWKEIRTHFERAK